MKSYARILPALLLTAVAAFWLPSAQAQGSGSVCETTTGWYDGVQIFAVTSPEYRDLEKAEIQKLAAARAHLACQRKGFDKSNGYKLEETSSLTQVGWIYKDKDTGRVFSKPEEHKPGKGIWGWETIEVAFSSATYITSLPILYYHRLFSELTCCKKAAAPAPVEPPANAELSGALRSYEVTQRELKGAERRPKHAREAGHGRKSLRDPAVASPSHAGGAAGSAASDSSQ